MGLAKLETENGTDLFLRPERVESIASSHGAPTCTVSMESGAKWLVRGSQAEVHAALFPTAQYEVPEEKREALLATLRSNALGSRSMLLPFQQEAQAVERGAYDAIRTTEVAEALDPDTYETEWQQHSPQCMRAMSHALSLVRARLGVMLDMMPEKKR